jgi:hypothetical protein
LSELAEASQARRYVFGFKTKLNLTLVSKLSQQSAIAKALPLIQEFIIFVGGR